jgi:hypothetical protein
MKPTVTLRKALNDPGLLGHVIAGPSWSTWRTLLIAAMGEKLTAPERAVFKTITGREHEPNQRVNILQAIAGRRGGKTRALATLASYLAGLCDHSDVLAPGEDGVLLCLAQDQRIAKKILDFCEEDFTQSPVLRQLLVGRSQDALELKHSICIEVRPASFRKLRGPTYIGVLADEAAFWYVEDHYANPDVEVLAAVRPGLLTTHGPLVIASSPYAKRGVLWDNFRKYYGPNGAPLFLVAKGTTRDFNPTVAVDEIERLVEEDRARNTAEYLAEFRSDLEAFVSTEAVQACVSLGVYERLPLNNVAHTAFCDPSGGASDAMTLCIAHMEYSKETVVVDALRCANPPFSPEAVVVQFCELLKSYRISQVTGDRYAGEWPKEQFGKYGVLYEPSAKPKSSLYQDLLPTINSRRVDLLDHSKMFNQLVSLERRTGRGDGIIDHPPGQHDDLANVVAGVVSLCITKGTYNWAAMADTLPDDPHGIEAYRAARLHDYIYSFAPNYGGRWR